MRRWTRRLGIVGLLLPLAAAFGVLALVLVGDGEPTWESGSEALAAEHLVYALSEDRRVGALALPRNYDRAAPLPLLLALHDRGGFVWQMNSDLQLSQRINFNRFAMIFVNAGIAADGQRAWNLEGDTDVAYLEEVIAEARELVAIDRIWLLGRGQGVEMADRLLCDFLDDLPDDLPDVSALVAVEPTGEPLPCAGAAELSQLEIDSADLAEPDNAARIIAWLRENG